MAGWVGLVDPEFESLARDAWTQVAPDPHVLHLCCNDGRELIWLLHTLGGSGVGVDFVDQYLQRGRYLARSEGVSASFVQSDVLDYLAGTTDQFDLVIMTLGTLWWIENLSGFFEGVSRILSPGGTVIGWDFHPIAPCLDDALSVASDYPQSVQARWHPGGVEDYVSDPTSCLLPTESPSSTRSRPLFVNDAPVTDYLFSLGELVRVLEINGLRLARLTELNWVWGERYRRDLVLDDRGKAFTWPREFSRLPLTMVFQASPQRA